MLEGLIKSVLDKIDPNILRRTVRRKHLMGGFRVAASIVAGLLRVDNLVDKIWDRVASDPRARNQMRDLMGHAMDQWMSKGRTPGRRLLVVFIDDLDRCSRQRLPSLRGGEALPRHPASSSSSASTRQSCRRRSWRRRSTAR